MSLISGFSEAEPTRKPSMSGHAESLGAFLALAEPPYWMRMFSAHSALTLVLSQSRSSLCVSCACSAEAETPVPMAHTGSYAMTTLAGSSDLMQ